MSEFIIRDRPGRFDFGVDFTNELRIDGIMRSGNTDDLGNAPIRNFQGTGPQNLEEFLSDRPLPSKIDRNISIPQRPPTRAEKSLSGIEGALTAQGERDRARSMTGQFSDGLKFMIDINNANAAYRGLELATQLNIMESRRQASLAVQDARAAGFRERTNAILEGENTALALAAQGQDVNSATVQRAVGSVEDMGIYNQLQQEIAGIREALGFGLEEVSLLYELDQAGITRDFQQISSVLEFAGNTAGNFAAAGVI